MLRGIVCSLAVLVLCGCSDPEAEQLARQNDLAIQGDKLSSILGYATPRVTANEQSLTIQLIFGEDADLDLYVTDPLLETVYFAKPGGKSGGRMSADVRCYTKPSAPTSSTTDTSVPQEPRIEEVRFDDPLPGRYRIGIDYPRKCEGGQAQAAFAVSVWHNGEQIQQSGSVTFEKFDVVFMEFDI